MNPGPRTITGTSLAHAWSDAFTAISQPGVSEIAPLIVTFPTTDERKHPIQALIDEALRDHHLYSTNTVANTMFPRTMWNQAAPRTRLYERYEKAYPLIKKAAKQNMYGTYFHRLIAYKSSKGVVNQLEHIITTYQGGNHRRSALQASVFDPAQDHTNQPRRGFPCMQQISFALIGDTDLHVNGFYATEYLFDKAYGNYLGLRDIGTFVAKELDRTLTRVTCTAGIALLGDRIKISDARTLANKVQNTLTPVAA